MQHHLIRCFHAFLFLPLANSVESCADPVSAKVSCNFETDWCGWRNSQDESRDWSKTKGVLGFGNEYAAFYVSNIPANSTALLESPWMCATGDETYSLRFEYYLYYSDRCRLSVLLRKESDNTTLWSEQRGEKKNSFKQLSSPLKLTSPTSSFQIIFEGKKLTNEPCGYPYNEIDIDHIEFQKQSDSGASSSATPCPSIPGESSTEFPTTTESGTTAPVQANAEAGKGANNDLAHGAVPGIVIGILLLVVVIAVLVFIWRRHKNGRPLFKGKEKSESRGTVVSPTVSNSIYFPAEAHANGPFHLSNTENTHQFPQEPRNQTGSENYYSTASEPYYTNTTATAATTGPKQDVNGYELVNPQLASTKSSLDDASQRTMQGATTTTSRDGAQACKGNTAVEDDYNKLSLQPTRAANLATGDAGQDHVYDSRTGPDTYNELAFGREPSEVPKSVADEYSQLQDTKVLDVTSTSRGSAPKNLV